MGARGFVRRAASLCEFMIFTDPGEIREMDGLNQASKLISLSHCEQ